MLGGERTRKDAVYQADGKGKIERQMILSPFADIDRNFTTLTRSINRWFFCASFEFLVCTYEFSCILTDLKRSLPFFPYIVSFFLLFSLVFTPCRISLCFLLPPLTFLYFFFFFILPFGTHSRLSIFLFLFSISSVLPFLQCFILLPFWTWKFDFARLILFPVNFSIFVHRRKRERERNVRRDK